VGQEDEAMLAAFMRRQWAKVFRQHIACVCVRNPAQPKDKKKKKRKSK
jgi:hypothetical protein